MIQGSTGEAGQFDIRFPGGDEGDIPAPAGGPDQCPADRAWRKEISRDDPDGAGLLKVVKQGGLDGAPVLAGSAGEEGGAELSRRVAAKRGTPGNPVETAVLEVRHSKHPVKRFGQVARQGTGQLQAEIAPPPVDAIPELVAGNVESADDGGGSVTNQKFPVIPEGDAAQCERIEEPHDSACGGEGVPVVRRQFKGAKGVEQDPDGDTSPGRSAQDIPDGIAGLARHVDVHFQTDGVLGPADVRRHSGEKVVACCEPLIGCSAVHEWVSVYHTVACERKESRSGLKKGV